MLAQGMSSKGGKIVQWHPGGRRLEAGGHRGTGDCTQAQAQAQAQAGGD